MGLLQFAVVDLETTGLHPGANHRIVELAVVHLDGAGQITGTWETLLNPGRDLGPQSIHGIRASDVLAAPTFEQIAGHLVQLLEGRVLVAHNVSFDHRFLEAEFRRTGREFPLSHHDALCTMQLARTFLPGSRRGLKDCCAAFDIDLLRAHSAGGDAIATAQLLASYLRLAPSLPVWREAMRNVDRILWPHVPVLRTTGVVRRPAEAREAHFLERIADRMPETSGPAAHTEYLALLDRCLLDRRLSVHERNELVELANTLGINRSSCEGIHQIYFEQLASVAWEDGILTPEEKHDLEVVADLLSIEEGALRTALSGPPQRNTFRQKKSDLVLSAGDKIVLTGDMGRPRAEWERLLVERGFTPWGGVTREVKLVAAADPDSLSGKARKAREYGIPIVDEQGLERLVLRPSGGSDDRSETNLFRMSAHEGHSMGEGKLAFQGVEGPSLDTPVLMVEIDVAPTLSFAMEQSGVPLIRAVHVRNDGADALQTAELELRLEPGLSEPHRIAIPPLLPGETADLGVVDVRLPPGRLREMEEKERAQLVWSVNCSGEELAKGTTDVEVLPFNQWPGYLGGPPALLASFVTPNHPVIGPLLKRVAARLGEATGSTALDGYQQRDPGRIRAMVLALYEELSSLGIVYAEVPASFEQTGQKVRLPDRVLCEQLGCCLDLSLLFASCLEQMGLAPLVVAIRGHAFPAVWLVDDRFPEGLVEDPSRVRTQLDLNQILTWESTLLTSGAPFEQAMAHGRAHLRADETFVFALDVRACRSEFRPLPLRAVGIPPDEEDGPTPQRLEIVRILRSAAETPLTTREPDPVPEDVATRFRRWKDRLLDLTLRNKLLNLRTDRRDVLSLQIPDLGAFEDLLATNERFEIVGRPLVHGRDERDPKLLRARVETEDSRQRLLGDLARKILHSHQPQDRLYSQAVELIRSTRTDLEEGGATTLFVTVGVLKWTELGTRQERLAPLILYPVELGFERARARLTLKRLDDQDPIANVTLIEKLRRDFAIDLSALAHLDQDDAGLDVKALLDGVRRQIQAHSGFEVLEDAHVARLSFSRFLMWKDLEDNAHHLLENPVVRHIAGVDSVWEDTVGDVAASHLDETVPAQALPAVLDADSTQLAAVVAALRGRSFVLQGPPGTGKSQTITNLVAAAIAEGKSVLFVSEKMAALEVVHRRLQQVGLGDFCLELHSHKANKKEVLHSFATSIERQSRTHVSQWEAESKRLSDMRLRLNGYAKALHQQRPVGFTVFEGSARLRDLLGAPEIRISIPNASSVDEKGMRTLREATSAFADRGEAVEPIQQHPWRHSRKAQFLSSDEEALLDALSGIRDNVETCEREAAGLEKAIGHTAPRSIPAMRQLCSLAAVAAEGEIPEAALGERWDEQAARADAWILANEDWRSRRETLGQRWQPSFLERSDLQPLQMAFQTLAGTFFLLAFLFLWGARRRLRAEGRGPLGDNRSVLADLSAAIELMQQGTRLERERAELGAFLDPVRLARGKVVREARHHLPQSLLATLVERSSTMAQERRDQATRYARELSNTLDELSRYEEDARRIAEITSGDGWPFSDDPQQIPQLGQHAAELLGGRQHYRAHCLYNETAAQLEALGHGALVEAHREGRLAAKDIPAAFERNFLARWLAEITDREPALRSFDGRTQDRLVADFATLDKHHLDLSRAWVIANAEARLPPPGAPAVAGGEMQLLRREIAKKARHMAVRRLLQNLPGLLPRLKPCLLMSPLSVAQYLPPTARFDLVVFDEASQIGTHDAIGAIARGRQVVVVGDSKQLPPTAFFQRAGRDEDDLPDENDIAELESVLDEVKARGLPQQMLGWHYRSRHDTLIDFSNRHYYENRLLVFPAARQVVEDLGVKWHHVPEGAFLSGGDRTNPVEAQALVEHLVEQLRSSSPEQRTFGVVTFSLPQRRLIEDLLDEARRDHPEIEAHFVSDEPVFVKNLENVQGDERDEILFSIGYAKDEGGRLRMQFGPLSTAGGERRLNVAITRARCQLRVFSTLAPEDIDLGRTNSTGASHLKSFLQFVARGATVRSAAVTRAFESRFHREVHDALVAAGYKVATAVGCAGYRVDLAVEKPGEPGVYALGIELDGTRWASAETARDRERLRHEVLGSLGWHMVRVWTPEWSRDPEGQLQRILSALQKALAGEPPRTTRPRPVVEVVAKDMSFDLAVWMKTPPINFGTVDDIHSSPEKVGRRVAEVVDFEGPIHEDELAERVAESWQARRLGSRIRQAIDEQVSSLVAAGRIVRRGPFLWPQTLDPTKHTRVRAKDPDGGFRSIERLPPEEIARAAAFIRSANGSLSEEELVRETAKLLGLTRLTDRLAAVVRRGLG